MFQRPTHGRYPEKCELYDARNFWKIFPQHGNFAPQSFRFKSPSVHSNIMLPRRNKESASKAESNELGNTSVSHARKVSFLFNVSICIWVYMYVRAMDRVVCRQGHPLRRHKSKRNQHTVGIKGVYTVSGNWRVNVSTYKPKENSELY